jgi:hypothetical protein
MGVLEIKDRSTALRDVQLSDPEKVKLAIGGLGGGIGGSRDPPAIAG